jgi:VanZ family protein
MPLATQIRAVQVLLRPVLFPPRWMRLLALLAFVVVAANLFWHGAQPYAVGAIPAPWDKLAHLLLYGGFSGAAWVTLGGGRRTADLLAPLTAITVGIADELAQALNPGRAVSFSDLAADMLGALLVVAMLAWLRERQRSPALARSADRSRSGSSPARRADATQRSGARRLLDGPMLASCGGGTRARAPKNELVRLPPSRLFAISPHRMYRRAS